MTCPICGDELKHWAVGKHALANTLGATALDDRWLIFRCQACGFVSIHSWENEGGLTAGHMPWWPQAG
jgi:uncharacterized Zn finger protein